MFIKGDREGEGEREGEGGEKEEERGEIREEDKSLTY